MLKEKDVAALAELCKLRVPVKEFAALARDLDNITAYVERLAEADIDDVPPFGHAPATDAMRADVPASPLGSEAALKDAPGAQPPFFRTPRIIAEG